MSTETNTKQYAKDLSLIINDGLFKSREDYDKTFDEADLWLNDIITRNPKLIEAKESCEICERYSIGLEAHHIAGRKHDDRTIMVCKQCHRILSIWQKAWGNAWEKCNQPERMKRAFFLLGLRDLLRLKSKMTGNSIYESMADNLTEDISSLLKGD